MKKTKTPSKQQKSNPSGGIASTSYLNNKWLQKHFVWLVLFIVGMVYHRVFLNDLTNRDDDFYVLMNPFIRFLDWETIRLNFTLYYMGNYHPLSMLCMALGFQLGGTEAWPYQLINLMLHLLNTLLVFHFIRQLLLRASTPAVQSAQIAALTALLFGIHTLQVESVAWISENKNVLHTSFFLMSLIQYVRYTRSGNRKIYLLSLFLFSLALFSKATAVTLSLCLPLVDYFVGRKVFCKKVIFEKLPFLVLSLIFGILAIHAQKSAMAIGMDETDLNFGERVIVACYGFVQYLVKLMLPVNLSAYYEYPPGIGESLPVVFYFYPVVVILLLVLFIRYFRKSLVVITGSLFFLVNISLVLQVLPVGSAIMADRYFYLPSIGLFLILAYYFIRLMHGSLRYKKLFSFFFVSYVLMLCVLTFVRIGVWKDSLTLWTDILAKADYDPHSAAWYARAGLYNDEGRYAEAIRDIEVYLGAHPDDGDSYFKRAYARLSMNDMYGAIEDLDKSEKLGAKDPSVYNNRGYVKLKLGDYMSAIDDFSKAIEINSGYMDAYKGRADVYLILERYSSAEHDLLKVLEMDRDDANLYNNLGLVKNRQGEYQAALDYLDKANRLQPGFMEALQNRVDAKFGLKDYQGAIDDLNRILLQEQVPYAYYYRGKAYLQMGMGESACADFEKAVGLGYVMIDKFVLDSCETFRF